MNFPIRPHTILLTLTGSRAYGISTPESDVDVKGVAVAPLNCYLGLGHGFEQTDSPAEMDRFRDCLNQEQQTAVAASKLEGTIYEVRKFIHLAQECNPNILDVLFCRDQDALHESLEGTILRERRQLFISAKAKHTFSGYAASQMKRIRGHRSWLLSPPHSAPTRAEFNLPDNTLIPADQRQAAEAAIKLQINRWQQHLECDPATKIELMGEVERFLTDTLTYLGYPDPESATWLAAARTVGLSDNLIWHLQQEKAYQNAQIHWKQYQKWKTERNPARAELEARFGYDTKHAAHLFRLMAMGHEILTTGQVHVWRGGRDADTILGIRKGAWSYDQLEEWFQAQDESLNAIYQAGQYSIPHQPNRIKIDELCQGTISLFHSLD